MEKFIVDLEAIATLMGSPESCLLHYAPVASLNMRGSSILATGILDDLTCTLSSTNSLDYVIQDLTLKAIHKASENLVTEPQITSMFLAKHYLMNDPYSLKATPRKESLE